MAIKITKEIEKTYTILDEIGSGGGGTVYKAYHKNLEKYVVFKKIHSNVKNQVEIRAEVDTLKHLRHSYLPQVLDFFEVDGDVYTVMDYIPGKSFQELLKEGRRFKSKSVMKYTKQLFEVLAYLHQQTPSVIHGDIKPANIMLTPEDDICLIDFNISGAMVGGDGVATVGYSAGYAAPEQCEAANAAKKELGDGNKTKINTEKTELLDVADVERTEMLTGEASEKTELLREKNAEKTELLVELDEEKTWLTGKDKFRYEIVDENSTELMFTSKDDEHDKKILMDKKVVQVFANYRTDVYSAGATIYHIATGKRAIVGEPIALLDEAAQGYSAGFGAIIAKAMDIDPDKRYQSGQELYKAIQQIHKYDKKYKATMLKQNALLGAMVVLLGASAALAVGGYNTIGREKAEAYNAYVEKLSQLAEQGDESEFETIYKEAKEYMPAEFGADYQKAIFLEKQGRYVDLINFLQEDVTNQVHFAEQTDVDQYYYFLAHSYFELEAYNEAAFYYERAIEKNPTRVDYYVECAIARAKNGDVEEAETILQKGSAIGMESDYVELANGEILSAKGNVEQAIESFEKCIHSTKNEAIKFRAYICCDQAIHKQGTDQNILEQSVELLNRASADVDINNQILVLERLAQDYIDLSKMSDDMSYNSQAISVFKKIEQLGWDNYTTHMNLAVLYENAGEFELAFNELGQMLNLEPNNYVTYMRLARLELDALNNQENEARDYTKFVEYYSQAKELYSSTEQGGETIEMQWLDDAFQQLKENGLIW